MYNRTQNENGSFNTRCLYCFMTVASCVESEPELDKLETRHLCPEKVLADLAAHGDHCLCREHPSGASEVTAH
jgi:hypothetical protein